MVVEVMSGGRRIFFTCGHVGVIKFDKISKS